MISHDPHFPIADGDALLYAEPLPDDGEVDVLAGMGFGPDTGTDVALRHEGMLALGLQMQEEYDQWH